VKVVPVRAGGREYQALIGPGALARLGTEAAKVLRGPGCAVVCDENTAPLFCEQAFVSLRAAGFDPTLITIPAGEKSKSLEQVGAVCDEMAAAGLDRSSFVVAIGGGVVGDLAGFAAAIYHRGIAHIQVPTTLLAQVDSAIGGKTAVNTTHGKNLLGAVHQPALVVADTETLRSLPKREFNQGFAEIIKHATIADVSLFELLEEYDADALPELVRRNIAIKAGVVGRDELDVSGERAILNFGHTVGHGIERAAQYGRLLHGEAISLGIVVACEISVRRAGLPDADRDRVVRTLQAFDLPTRLPTDVARDQILPGIRSDKKFERGEARFVVTPGLGSARLPSEITIDDIAAAIERL